MVQIFIVIFKIVIFYFYTAISNNAGDRLKLGCLEHFAIPFVFLPQNQNESFSFSRIFLKYNNTFSGILYEDSRIGSFRVYERIEASSCKISASLHFEGTTGRQKEVINMGLSNMLEIVQG